MNKLMSRVKVKKISKLRAFTLMEVLVALVVLSIALSSLIMTGTEIASNMRYLRSKTVAHWVARNVYVEAKMGMINIKRRGAALHGSEQMLGETWQWHANVFKTEDKNTSRLVIHVDSNDRVNVYELTGFVSTVES